MLSLGIPFDSLQPAARFRIQDGGRNSRNSQDYVVLAAHKIPLSINPNIIVNGFLMIRNLSCVSCSSVFLTVRAWFTSKYFLYNRSESSLRRSYFQSPQHNFITSCSTTITNLTLRPFSKKCTHPRSESMYLFWSKWSNSIYTLFQTKTAAKPYPFWPHIPRTYMAYIREYTPPGGGIQDPWQPTAYLIETHSYHVFIMFWKQLERSPCIALRNRNSFSTPVSCLETTEPLSSLSGLL